MTNQQKQLTLVQYVDDLLLTCKDAQALDHIIQLLQDTYDQITVNKGKLFSYLGMRLDFSSPGSLDITMPAYIDSLCQGITQTAATPALPGLFIKNHPDQILSPPASKALHSVIARLLYLALRVRPDILTAVQYLACQVSKLSFEDYKKVNHVQWF